MAEEEQKKKKQDDDGAGALFIPAGVLTGIGVGFLVENVPAGTMIGLGIGFLLFALVTVFKK